MTNGSGIVGLDLVNTPPAQPGNLPGTPPNFDQIPLNKDNFFPLDELQAQGGYNRKLILPDDVIPTLNMPYAWTHDGVPKVHRAQDSGALNVHVENSSGGGNSPVAVNRRNLVQQAFSPNQNIHAGPSSHVLYGVTWAVAPDPSSLLAGHSDVAALAIVDSLGGTVTIIGAMQFLGSSSVAAQNQVIIFAFPLNLAAMGSGFTPPFNYQIQSGGLDGFVSIMDYSN